MINGLLQDALVVVGGLFVGLLSSTMGIGGGLVMVPLLVLGFRVNQHVAQGTSLVAIVPTSLVGALTHHNSGNVLVRAALWMGGAGAVGAFAGALLAIHLPKDILARVFGLMLLFTAYRLWPRRQEAAVDT